MAAISEDEGQLRKERYARYFWQIVRGIVVIVAVCGFIAFLSVDVYGAKLGFTAFAIFTIATLTLRVMPIETATPTLEIEGETTVKKRHRLPEWSLLAYGVIFSVGCNWECVFLWFSRRYDFFSIPVIGATVLMMVLYSAIALVVTHLTTRNWRTAVVLCAFAPGALAGIVLRLRLLR